MSDADDALREMAANRGCKLVSSRVRTPGRRDYGRFGLKDAKSGRAVYGFGKSGLTASREEIADFLRGDAAATWKGSVGSAKRAPTARATPEPGPKAPKLVLRAARPGDAEAIAALIVALGYEVGAADVKKRLRAVDALVADRGGVIGVLTTNMMTVLHRPRPVGRISMMVVAETARGGGVGAAMVAEAERLLAAKGCGLVEVTSNMKRSRAHGSYEKLGYERTSYRFAKPL